MRVSAQRCLWSPLSSQTGGAFPLQFQKDPYAAIEILLAVGQLPTIQDRTQFPLYLSNFNSRPRSINTQPLERMKCIGNLRLDSLARPPGIPYPARRDIRAEFQVAANHRTCARRKKPCFSSHTNLLTSRVAAEPYFEENSDRERGRPKPLTSPCSSREVTIISCGLPLGKPLTHVHCDLRAVVQAAQCGLGEDLPISNLSGSQHPSTTELFVLADVAEDSNFPFASLYQSSRSISPDGLSNVRRSAIIGSSSIDKAQHAIDGALVPRVHPSPSAENATLCEQGLQERCPMR